MSSVENTATNVAPETKAERKPLELKVNTHETLNCITECENMTASDLAGKINRVFRGIFHDYSGSRITVDPQYRQLVLELFFEDHGTATDGKFKNIIPLKEGDLQESQKNNMLVRAQRMDLSKATQRAYTLTDETKELLVPFLLAKPAMIGGVTQLVAATGKDLDITGVLVNEISVPNNQFMGQNSSRIVVTIKGLDINKLVALMYGTEIEGKKYDYSVNPMTPVAGTNEWIVSVNRLDKKELNALAIKAGAVNTGVTWVQA